MKRESGRKVQTGNINAAKVSLIRQKLTPILKELWCSVSDLFVSDHRRCDPDLPWPAGHDEGQSSFSVAV